MEEFGKKARRVEVVMSLEKAIEHLEHLEMAVMGVGLAIVSATPSGEATSDDFISLVPADMYESALEIAQEICDLQLQETLSGNQIPDDEGMTNLTEMYNVGPERVWPLSLMMAVYKDCGLDEGGCIPDTEISIFSQDIPHKYVSKISDVINTIKRRLIPFIETGTSRIESHLQYPQGQITPVMFYMAAQIAKEEKRSVSANLHEWFPSCYTTLISRWRAEAAASGMSDHGPRLN